nr:MAG TPA: hypothetical protein [Caudoviricetes sp.]
MRPRSADVEDWPGSRPYHGKGLCARCSSARRAAEWRRSKGVQPKAARRRNPTVAELAAAGHPCVSPAPMPSRVRSYPL